MSFKFNYVPVEQLSPPSTLLAPGEGHFVITRSYQTDQHGAELKTRDGDLMLKLELTATDCRGEKGTIYDILVANNKNAWKIKLLLDCLGKPELYTKDGEFNPSELIGLQGRAKFKTQVNPAFSDKTVIDRYLPFDEAFKGQVSFKGQKEDELDDGIPF